MDCQPPPDARLTQAVAGDLGHLDFLTVLCQDEISRRDTMSIHRRLRKARFDEQTTLEGFDFAASQHLEHRPIRRRRHRSRQVDLN